MLVGQREGRLRQGDVAESGLSVDMARLARRAEKRFAGTGRDRNTVESEIFAQSKCICGRTAQSDVPANGGHPDEIDVRVAVREQQRQGVVEAGVAVEQDLFRHGSTVPHRWRSTDLRCGKWCFPRPRRNHLPHLSVNRGRACGRRRITRAFRLVHRPLRPRGDPSRSRDDGRHRRGSSRLRRRPQGDGTDVQIGEEEPPAREAGRDRRGRQASGREHRNGGLRPHRRRDPRHPARNHRGCSHRRNADQVASLLHLQAALHAGRRVLPPALPRLRRREPRQA